MTSKFYSKASWDQLPPVGTIWVRRFSITVHTKFGAEPKWVLMNPPHKDAKGRLYKVPLFSWETQSNGCLLA